ncbi:protein phosphatase 1 regulatory subunit 1B-like [Coregonus clupeaformis]|uniref:protein phosphatase 1 regulatory subunit 1B-like n=1 Tax=Coregonus clupeaformis TaxID=59861 RepID=UPI001BE08B61|nr:protein phosphatase 1 regulatory subunit 1B-like [Coregonus clupeaformis]
MDADAKDKERKTKIQFSVPSAMPLQLDPRQVEMIRRRRPTPATLFRLTDQPSPEEENDNHQWVIGENGVLTKKINAHVYQPPSLKAVQRMAQAHMKSLGTCGPEETDDFSGEESEDCEESVDISHVSTTVYPDSQEDQSERFQGSRLNSEGRIAHFLHLRVPHGEEEEEEDDEEKREKGGPRRTKKKGE